MIGFKVTIAIMDILINFTLVILINLLVATNTINISIYFLFGQFFFMLILGFGFLIKNYFLFGIKNLRFCSRRTSVLLIPVALLFAH